LLNLALYCAFFLQIRAAFRTDEIRRTPPTPQDEMRAGMSYFHETIWKGVPKFLRRVDTALKKIGINERIPYNVPLIQFSSWMGGDRDGNFYAMLYMSSFFPFLFAIFKSAH
jgi:phosphoenolpyruvate carboxylase